MKSLMTYGRSINENAEPSKNYSLEYHKEAADGKTYGIVKEYKKYYIKQAESGKELVAESYKHLGGYMNKRNYEYDSYNDALKNLELKLASINEACEGNVNIATLDPFKKEDLIIEGTEKMKDEIARQRQIMHNAAMIMNESFAPVKGDKAENNNKQPEAETGKKGDEEYKDAKVEDQDKVKGTQGLDKKVGPFTVNPSKVNEGCECTGKPDCCCGKCKKKVNEEVSATDTDFDDGLKPGLTSHIGDGDPFEKHETVEDSVVNEEVSATDTDFDEGAPSNAEAGVGEADTDHNNDPFNKDVTGTVNEEAEDFADDTVDVESDGDDLDIDSEFDFGDDEEAGDGEGLDDEDFSGTEIDINDADDETGENLGDTEATEEVDENDPESIKAEIERLQSLLNDLEDDATEADVDVADLDADAAVADDEAGDLGDAVDGDSEFPEAEDFKDVDTFDDDVDECGGMKECGGLYESKEQFLKSIVESVTRDMRNNLLKEEELHDFGKHPGYRKKPMDLPQTGQDKNQWGRDWNDDSVHSEEPFGKQIGDSAPFNLLVDAVTKDVLYQLKKGVPLDNKKKD